MEHHKIVTVKRGLAKIVNCTTGEEVGYLERVDMPHNDLRMGAWVAYRPEVSEYATPQERIDRRSTYWFTREYAAELYLNK